MILKLILCFALLAIVSSSVIYDINDEPAPETDSIEVEKAPSHEGSNIRTKRGILLAKALVAKKLGLVAGALAVKKLYPYYNSGYGGRVYHHNPYGNYYSSSWNHGWTGNYYY